LAQNRERNVAYSLVDIPFLRALTRIQASNEHFTVIRKDEKLLLCTSPKQTYTLLSEIPDATFVTGWQNYDGKSGQWTSWNVLEEIISSGETVLEDRKGELFSDKRFGNWECKFTEPDFVNAVKNMKNEMKAGDYFLANLTRTETLNNKIDSYFLAAMSCIYHETPFRAFFKTSTSSFLGLSPERFLKIENNKASCEPMKGTAKSADQLVDNEKEHDENTMMIDLMRSDLSKICVPLSITVDDRNVISLHPGLAQMSSKISGQLESSNILEAIERIMPVASTSGTPKPRVLKAIDHYEPENRNEYCGAYGWIDTQDNSCDLAVSIRCIISNETQTRIGVGAGITISSNPQSEYNETELKASKLKKLVQSCLKPSPKGVFTSTSIDTNNAIFAYDLHKERFSQHAKLEGLNVDEKQIDMRVIEAIEDGIDDRPRYLKISIDTQSNIFVETPEAPTSNEYINVGISFLPELYELECTKRLNRDLYNDALINAQKLSEVEIEDSLVVVDGLVTETTRANIFLEIDGAIITPSLSSTILSGVARSLFINSLKDEKIEVIEKNISLDDVLNASEIITINSVRGPQKIRSISSALLGSPWIPSRTESILFTLAKHSFNSYFFKVTS